MARQPRYWDRPTQPGVFKLKVSTLLMLIAILTHEKVGRDFLVSLLDMFGLDKAAEIIRAFSQMTDRLLLIAAGVALISGFYCFMNKKSSRQYWWEIGLCIALVLWIDPH